MERHFRASHAPRRLQHPLLATLMAWVLLTGAGIAVLAVNASRAEARSRRPSLLSAMQAQDGAHGWR